MNTLFNQRKKELQDYSKRYRLFHHTSTKKEVPDHLFIMCPKCKETVLSRAMIENQNVCPSCFHHLHSSAKDRISSLVDPKSFKEMYGKLETSNDENFPDYDKKLEKAKKNSGLNEAVVCGVGKINTHKVALCVMDSTFMMASMGKVVGEKITKMVEYATKKHLPLIIFTASGGARMQEGIDSLMQMAKVSAALKRFSNAGNLYIVVLTNPTTGGVSASFAMLGDIILAEPGATIGFAGRRVIQNTIKQELPEDFQTSEFMLAKGFVDRIVERKNLRKELGDLLSMHEEIK